VIENAEIQNQIIFTIVVLIVQVTI